MNTPFWKANGGPKGPNRPGPKGWGQGYGAACPMSPSPSPRTRSTVARQGRLPALLLPSLPASQMLGGARPADGACDGQAGGRAKRA